MTFFNKKEDVIKIELTPHGRSLLSKGKLKPAYYAFYDDDILYDSKKGGFSEESSETKGRILSGTISLRPVVTDKGVESSFKNRLVFESENYLPYPIGTNSHIEEKTSAWDITLLHNEISSSNIVLSSSTTPTLNVPQVECELEYTMSIGDLNDENVTMNKISSMPFSLTQGNKYIRIDEEQILLHLSEKNGFSHKDSFEVEVYLYEEDETKVNRLNFGIGQNRIINDILEEGPIPPIEIVDTGFQEVEHYLNIYVDSEIPEEDICRGIKYLKAKNVYLDLDLDFECPDREALEIDIYDYTPEEIEDCEV